MKSKFYFLFLISAIGFTSCQKTPYATFQKSRSETFAKTIKSKPIRTESSQTPEVSEVVNQIPPSNITASITDDIAFEEPSRLFSTVKTASIEVATVSPAPKGAATPATITHVSGKHKLLKKILAKKINKLNKKAEKANSSTVRGSNDLLYIGLVVLVIGLLLTLVPIANVFSGIVIAAGAIIAIIGLLQRIL